MFFKNFYPGFSCLLRIQYHKQVSTNIHYSLTGKSWALCQWWWLSLAHIYGPKYKNLWLGFILQCSCLIVIDQLPFWTADLHLFYGKPTESCFISRIVTPPLINSYTPKHIEVLHKKASDKKVSLAKATKGSINSELFYTKCSQQ